MKSRLIEQKPEEVVAAATAVVIDRNDGNSLMATAHIFENVSIPEILFRLRLPGGCSDAHIGALLLLAFFPVIISD